MRKRLFIEHGLLFVAGLGVGGIASVVAMIPALIISKSQVSAGFLLGLLAVVVLCGAVCMTAAVRVSLRGDALRGLRNE